MAWLCDVPTSFDIRIIDVDDIDPGDRIGWFVDGPWYRPTNVGDFIYFGFDVSPGKRAYLNVQGLNDGVNDRSFDVRIDGGSWMHQDEHGAPTGSNVTLLTVPNVFPAAWCPDDYGVGWENGVAPGSHIFEVRASTLGTNLIRFEVNEYDDCLAGWEIGPVDVAILGTGALAP